MKAIDRFLCIEDYSKKYNFPYVEWAKYYNGKELWNNLQTYLAEGREGMVITYEDAKYEPGKRSAKISLKIKKELQETIDCVIMGANSPTKQYTGKEPEIWEYWFDESTNEKILAKDFLEKSHYYLCSLFRWRHSSPSNEKLVLWLGWFFKAWLIR